MLYITKGAVNKLVLTLSESATVISSTYTFLFTNEFDVDSTPIEWIATDTSPYSNRYNLFQLEEGVDVTLKAGQYNYEVKDDNNTTVESGRMVVEGDGINSIYE